MIPIPEPMGAVLAGGRGRRIGGQKATVLLAGQPLIAYPLTALGAVLSDVVVLAKVDTELPDLPGMKVWIERPGPAHPLVGIVEALGVAEGRPVLVCGCDLPLLTPGLVHALASADPGGALAVIASTGGELQPMLGCYQPGALAALAPLAARAEIPLRKAVGGLAPRLLEVEDQDQLFNVNSPEQLLQARAILDRRPPRDRVRITPHQR
ncbi:MAG: molybdenum cofactor guanylyltransferase [Solirubrobacteraceae bacterium]